jgi:hypothetical protein
MVVALLVGNALCDLEILARDLRKKGESRGR